MKYRKKFIVIITACVFSLSPVPVLAGPDLPDPPPPEKILKKLPKPKDISKPPKPDELPKPPKPKPHKGKWWDPLGFFSDDDD